MKEITTEMSEWAHNFTLEDAPNAAKHEAKRCLLDVVGVGLAGSALEKPTLLRKHTIETYASGKCTVFRHGQGMAAAAASFANASACHVLDYDDTCYDGIAHGSSVVFPAVLAAAETTGATGQQMLEAFIVGTETIYRIGRALEDKLYHKGWWTTGLLGCIGAAAGAAKLLCQTQEQIDCALRTAAALTSGNKVVFGSTAKVIGVGRAAQLGLECAQLASMGIEAPAAPLTGPLGIVNMYNDSHWNEENSLPFATSGFSLEQTGIAFKMYPCCSAAQSAIDAAIELVTEKNLQLDRIESIGCDTTPFVASCLTYDRPQTVPECQFSLPFLVACALRHGTVGPQHLQLDCLQEPELQKLLNGITKEVTSEMKQLEEENKIYLEANRVTINMKGGESYSRLNKIARGMPQLPVSDKELIDKFLNCSEDFCDNNTALVTADRLLNLDQDETPVATLFQRLVGITEH